MNETPVPTTPQKRDHIVAITAIVATALVLLTCIAGVASIIITAIMKAH